MSRLPGLKPGRALHASRRESHPEQFAPEVEYQTADNCRCFHVLSVLSLSLGAWSMPSLG